MAEPPVTTTTLETSVSGSGDQLNQSGATASENLIWDISDNFKYAVVSALQELDVNNVPLPIDFKYDKDIDVDIIKINKKGSTAKARIEDPALSDLKDYDSPTVFGIDYDKTITKRHHIAVVKLDEQGEPEPARPADGTLYNLDKIVLFSGYHIGPQLDMETEKCKLTYKGIEQALNEQMVNGIVNYDLTAGANAGTISAKREFIKFEDSDLVFNKGGTPDRLDTSSSGFGPGFNQTATSGGVVITAPMFNRSGFGPTKYWSILDILKYLIRFYFEVNDENRDLPERHFGLNTKNNDVYGEFPLYNIPSAIQTELDKVKPTNFRLQNMGLLQALIATVEYSKSYFLQFKYLSDGRVEFLIRNKNPSKRLAEDPDDLEIIVSRNQLFFDVDKTLQQENLDASVLFMNREFHNLGQVVIHGAKLKINTLVTTSGNKDQVDKDELPLYSVPDSADEPTFKGVLPSATVDFDKHLDMFFEKDISSENGVQKYIYKFTNFNLVKKVNGQMPVKVTDINGINLSIMNEDDGPLELFDSLKQPRAIYGLQPAYSERNEKEDKDIMIFAARPSAKRIDTVVDPVNKFVYPYFRDDDIGEFQIILPLEKVPFMGAKLIPGDKGGIAVYEENGKDNTDSNKTNMEEYELKSLNKAALKKIGIFKSVRDRLVPLFIRCTIECDYRTKGIAQITAGVEGTDFNPKEHDTLHIYDESFEFALNYLDHTYDEDDGSFQPVTDGLIKLSGGGSDSDAQEPLIAIQERAETILEKYTNAQNSGALLQWGVQARWAIGDYIKEIGGTNRKFDFPSIVNTIEFDLQNRFTKITLGGIDG